MISLDIPRLAILPGGKNALLSLMRSLDFPRIAILTGGKDALLTINDLARFLEAWRGPKGLVSGMTLD